MTDAMECYDIMTRWREAPPRKSSSDGNIRIRPQIARGTPFKAQTHLIHGRPLVNIMSQLLLVAGEKIKAQ
ncbi:mCG148352 [Mus musculus]|jgi:hypothetical protein|nr:mCG148352 [Mus musculus]